MALFASVERRNAFLVALFASRVLPFRRFVACEDARMDKLLVSKSEIAKATTLSVRTLDKLVAAGKIPSVRVGTRRLFDPEAVTAALKSGVASPENGGLN